jgi:NADH:ubiquinone oxidoreductase subunit 6 (subunit J)
VIREAFALVVSLATLAFSFGVFVLPGAARANLWLLGAHVGAAAILLMTDAGLVAWSLVWAGIALYLTGSATPLLSARSRSGWHNWFAVAVTASGLWLLSLFILWTLEEAFSQPMDFLATAPAALEVVGAVFDRHLWAIALLALLGTAVAWGARGENA